MLKSEEAMEMERKLKESISLEFFEHGTHTETDLIFYEAYSEIQSLRMVLEVYEGELRELADELLEEVRPDDITH